MESSTLRRMAIAVAFATTAIGAVSADAAVYTSRAAFAATLGASFTDTYDDYGTGFQNRTDAQMTAVKNQTSYSATYFVGPYNYVFSSLNNGDYAYCAGCNGSFKLGFGNTSYGAGAGVFGAGFDVLSASNFVAFVTYGDGTSANYALTTGFFGVTSSALITSIAVGAVNGAPSNNGNASIDNLTIGRAAATGAVPEPATWAMMLMGFGGLGYAMRRRPKVNTRIRFA